jgi:predicted nucleic acid-binding protein
MLAIDASVAVDLCLSANGFEELAGHDLIAPPLIYSETLSTLHEMRWRGDILDDMTNLARKRYTDMPIRLETPSELYDEAWRIADQFGWAKIYDAQYVALAKLLGCQLVTADGKLYRGTKRLGFVITPEEL